MHYCSNCEQANMMGVSTHKSLDSSSSRNDQWHGWYVPYTCLLCVRVPGKWGMRYATWNSSTYIHSRSIRPIGNAPNSRGKKFCTNNPHKSPVRPVPTENFPLNLAWPHLSKRGPVVHSGVVHYPRMRLAIARSSSAKKEAGAPAPAGTGVVALHCMVQSLPRRRWIYRWRFMCYALCKQAQRPTTTPGVKAISSPISFSLYFQKAIMPETATCTYQSNAWRAGEPQAGGYWEVRWRGAWWRSAGRPWSAD
jgi:hypothetical protein